PEITAKTPDSVNIPPFETEDLRANLARFLDSEFDDPVTGVKRPIGNFRWGVYAFFDYDGEPIYVGQTNELLRTRIRRHLTNQRTDAVAMRILDPFEVAEVEMWPLWDLAGRSGSDPGAKAQLDALEYAAYGQAIRASRFQAILNEQIPPISEPVELPPSVRCELRGTISLEERTHPDVRIARRAETIARLAAVAR